VFFINPITDFSASVFPIEVYEADYADDFFVIINAECPASVFGDGFLCLPDKVLRAFKRIIFGYPM